MIELRNVSKQYKIKKGKKVLALNNISVKFPNKGMVFITGKSGSGKSTLLNLLGLLDKPSSGQLLINNKLTNKFRSKETDFYRNTCVGFIFQDYNLLEDFNVYKNIELAIDLQKKKIDKNKLNDILDIVGLDDLGDRKVNELSGGQKQRVAIGRAIVKNPNIILADEPTGNLDIENSKQIFNILKILSKKQLVIVVTHDVELAKVYADRIVEMEEGIIKSDTMINQIDEDEISDIKLIKSRLSILKAFEFSLYNLNSKKIRLMIMILLTTISFSVFGFFASLIKFDTNRTHAETMVEQNEARITINKKIVGKNYAIDSPVITFTDLEVVEVTNKLKKDVIKISKAIEDNGYLSFGFASYHTADDSDKKDYAYYDISLDYTLFLEYSDEKLNELNLIGEIPKNKNEIVINKILADYIIEKGLIIYEMDEKNNYVEDNFNPTSYEEIISSKKKIAFGSSYLVISGIVDEDMSKYESLKSYLSEEMELNKTKLYEEFITKYSKALNEVIVTSDFFERLELKPNDTLSYDFYKEVYLYDGKRIYPDSLTKILNEEIEVFDGKNYVKVNSLKDNQVIIGIATLDDLYDNEYSDKFFEYWEKLKENYEIQVKERENKIKEIEEKLLENPNYVYDYPEEIKELNYTKELNNFTINYVKEKQLIGKKMSLELNDLYLRVQNEQTKAIEDLEIVGIELNGVYTYFSNNLLEDYMRGNSEVVSIYFDENSKEELERIFTEFPSSNAKFVSETVYTKTINDVKTVVDKISKIAQYFAVGFLVFTIILFVYFIISSINQNKKNIGILRALGAKVSDIYKIFYFESFVIGMVAFALSSVITYTSCIVANNLISNNLFLNVKPIIFRFDLIYQMLIIVILLITISFVLPVFKIAKTKPIDTINKLG